MNITKEICLNINSCYPKHEQFSDKINLYKEV